MRNWHFAHTSLPDIFANLTKLLSYMKCQIATPMSANYVNNNHLNLILYKQDVLELSHHNWHCNFPNVKYSPFFQSNANQPMPLNADWLRIGRKCQCLTNPFEMDRIGNFGLGPQIKPIRNQSLIIKPML